MKIADDVFAEIKANIGKQPCRDVYGLYTKLLMAEIAEKNEVETPAETPQGPAETKKRRGEK